MVKIIVAFPSEERCTQLSTIIEESGFQIFRQCTSGSEVKRAMNQCHDGIVVTACRLPDCTADDLAWDLHGRATLLVTGCPQQLDLCEHPNLFRLAAPFSKGELTSAVNMLVQLYQMHLPRRSKADNELIAQAKEALMEKHGLTEPEAHHYLQQHAMNRGMKLGDYAARLLERI